MKGAAVIIPAAGKGVRTGLKTPKSFIPLAGAPLLARTIDVFHGHKQVGLIQPVLPRTQLSAFRKRFIDAYGWEKCRPAVAGGRERQDSVFLGLKALPEGVEFVIVHDAARPLVTAALISRVLLAARRHGAALAAIPLQDTVKKSTRLSLVEKTVDRRGLWIAQTPQAFRTGLLREAHSRAAARGFRATDDASLVEKLGHPVYMVTGSSLNLKVTTREDLLLARTLLGGNKET